MDDQAIGSEAIHHGADTFHAALIQKVFNLRNAQIGKQR